MITNNQTWIQDWLIQDQDQDSEVQDQDQDQDFMSKTKTETQDLQVTYWKSVTGMDCDKQKDWKSYGKQKIQHTGSCTQ